MTSNSAPSPNFNGIDFNDIFFPSVVGAYVDYPTAQGPTTISTLYSSVIDTLSAGTAFNFLNTLAANLNIATNGIAGQTIRVGAYTGASVHCANIDHQGNSINHATNASGGTLNLCNNMTGGTLNIGTNTSRTGAINIGTGAGAGNTGYINIGSSFAGTQIGGTLFSTGQITSSNGLLSIVSTADNLIGNGTNNSNASGNGVCSINKLQVGNTTTGGGIGTGTAFRCVIIGRNVGSTSAASGSITIAGAPTGAGNPLVFASLNANTTSNPYFLSVNPTGTNTFDYYKVFYNRSGTTFSNVIVGATGETFNYVAIWL